MKHNAYGWNGYGKHVPGPVWVLKKILERFRSGTGQLKPFLSLYRKFFTNAITNASGQKAFLFFIPLVVLI